MKTTHPLALSIGIADDQSIAQLQAHARWATRHALGKLALRLGLDLLRQHPERLEELLLEQRARRAAHG